jgi:hypothetical protein
MNESGLSASETGVEIHLYGWNGEGGFWHGPTEIAPEEADDDDMSEVSPAMAVRVAVGDRPFAA